MESTSLSHLDLLKLATNLGGKPDLVQELLLLFLMSCEQSLKHMDTSLEAGDLETWKREAHKVRGAAKNITAQKLANIAGEAESLKALDTQAPKLLTDLQHEHAAIRAYLVKHFPV